MLKKSYPMYVANQAITPNEDLEIFDKFNGELVTKAPLAEASHIEDAIAAAVAAEEAMAELPAYKRQEVLRYCVSEFTKRFDELAYSLCLEAGKPIVDARGEVTRLIDTFDIAAEEAVRIHGEIMPLDRTARTAGYTAYIKRVPIGACSFISPFNFPLNLAAHKVAPALAMGCPFILKPASLTPIGALLIGDVLSQTDLPKGAFSILPTNRNNSQAFTEDPRLKLMSFTGSPGVGWNLKNKAGKKKVVLELGGNAACIVDSDADLGDAVERIIHGAFYQSGQSCISVQRILIHSDIYDDFKERLVSKASGLVKGDPRDEKTFIGPMISEKEAGRLHGWIEEAKAAGATVLCGGKLENGKMLDATVMENVSMDQNLCAEEAFGPVCVLSKFTDFDAAIREVNNSKFGLQAGVFTRDLYKAQTAWDKLEVGGLMIGDVPSWRADQMPYGGVKDSGLGREGIIYAMEDMSELRHMVVRIPQK